MDINKTIALARKVISSSHKGSTFGRGTIDDLLKEEDVPLAIELQENILEIASMNIPSYISERLSSKSWIINGNRISVERINEVIKLLESIDGRNS